MPKKLLTILGIILILVMLSGLPRQWKTVYGVVVGVVLVAVSWKRKENHAHYSNFENGNTIRNTAINYSISYDGTQAHQER